MPTIKMKNIDIHTYGELPSIGSAAPGFILAGTDLEEVSRENFSGKSMLLNIYPSVDTTVCFSSVKRFNQAASKMQDVVVACISMDLPFALKRISEGEQFNNVLLLSDFRNRAFGDTYGLTLADGPLAGLLARAVVVLDQNHKIVYHELVKDITLQPDYDAALNALAKHQ